MAEAAAKLAAELARWRLKEAEGGGEEKAPEELCRSRSRCPRCVSADVDGDADGNVDCSPRRSALVVGISWALRGFFGAGA